MTPEPLLLTREIDLTPAQTLVVAFSIGCVGFTVYVLAHVVASVFAVLS